MAERVPEQPMNNRILNRVDIVDSLSEIGHVTIGDFIDLDDKQVIEKIREIAIAWGYDPLDLLYVCHIYEATLILIEGNQDAV